MMTSRRIGATRVKFVTVDFEYGYLKVCVLREPGFDIQMQSTAPLATEPSEKSMTHVEIAVHKLRSRLGRRSGCPNYAWKKFISLDGENSTYTTVLLICMNLSLLIWFFERGIMEGRTRNSVADHIEASVAGRRLFRSLVLILCAMFNGAVTFLLLTMNLRDLETMPENTAKRWLFMSGLGFVIANTGAGYIVYDAHVAYDWRKDRGSYEGVFPHYMILAVYTLAMIAMNFLYIRTMYLPFVRRKLRGWDWVRRNLSVVVQAGRRERRETTLCENVGYWIMFAVNKIASLFNLLIFHYFEFFEVIIRLCGRIYKEEGTCVVIRALTRSISEITLLPVRFLRWLPIVQLPVSILRMIKRSAREVGRAFQPMWEISKRARYKGAMRDAPWHQRVLRGMLQVCDRFFCVFSNFKPEVQKAADELWESVKEDETYTHSSWLKAAAVTAAILLVYFGVFMVHEFQGYMDEVYKPTRNCMINNPGVSNFFLRFIGFAPSNDTVAEEGVGENVCAVALAAIETDPSDPALVSNITENPALAPFLPAGAETASAASDAAALSQFAQMLSDRVQENRTEDRLYKCEDRRRGSDVCVMLAAVNMAEEMLANASSSREDPADVFFDTFSGEMVYLFDVYMRNLDWTIWIGFIVGLLFGCWTLLSVMGQYKRLSLAIRSGLFTDFDLERQYELTQSRSQKLGMLKRVDSIISNHSFAKVIASYPMSTSIFFSGMLISTAVLQLVVFGALVASIFSLMASLGDSEFLKIVTPLLWTILAFFVTWLVNGPIATLVLGEGLLVSQFQVIHEAFFFLFLLVFTSIHLVVGLFLAFFRMLWVLLTSLVTINRLDKCLFTLYKERDIGHKSFMALILMQHVFHVNRVGNQQEKDRWADVMLQLRNEAVRQSLRDQRHQRHQSEPMEMLDEALEAEMMEMGRRDGYTQSPIRHAQTSEPKQFYDAVRRHSD